MEVPSLAVPGPEATAAERRGSAAVELFVDRALSARPGLRLDDDAIATVAEIARRLDGMPLAIELAAARVGMVDLTGILEHLSDRFALLSGGSRTAPPRQQTLRATVAWSYDLLSAREKDLFGRMSVFPATLRPGSRRGRSRHGTRAGLRRPPGFGVQVDGRHRRGRTKPNPLRPHETLRQFGASSLDEATAKEARAAHARYYLSLVGSGSPEPFGPLVPWLNSVEREFDNLRAVSPTWRPGPSAARTCCVPW